jgi:hypothetical protein
MHPLSIDLAQLLQGSPIPLLGQRHQMLSRFEATIFAQRSLTSTNLRSHKNYINFLEKFQIHRWITSFFSLARVKGPFRDQAESTFNSISPQGRKGKV